MWAISDALPPRCGRIRSNPNICTDPSTSAITGVSYLNFPSCISEPLWGFSVVPGIVLGIFFPLPDKLLGATICLFLYNTGSTGYSIKIPFIFLSRTFRGPIMLFYLFCVRYYFSIFWSLCSLHGTYPFLALMDLFYVERGNRKKKVKRAGNLPTPLLEDMLAELEQTSR